MDIKIIVAAHKEYRMPQDSMYLPIHVGRAIAKQDFGWLGDDTDDNISIKNPNYCELTALYWAWKNLDADAIGLVHYRRYFLSPNISRIKKNCILSGICDKKIKLNSILSKHEAEEILINYPVILPKKRYYYIETVESQYKHAHQQQDINITREILNKNHKKYLKSFDLHMQERSTHLYNMFIMKKKYFDNYCSWLFDVLFKVEKELDVLNYLKNNARTLGFLGERLLDIWITTNKISYLETNVVYLESQNWIKKGFNFLYRKFLR